MRPLPTDYDCSLDRLRCGDPRLRYVEVVRALGEVAHGACERGVRPRAGHARAGQAVSEHAFIYPHLALMPDAHLGKDATVGSVIPTVGAIIPAAVGVDIGCGMIAVRTRSLLACPQLAGSLSPS